MAGECAPELIPQQVSVVKVDPSVRAHVADEPLQRIKSEAEWLDASTAPIEDPSDDALVES
ncbi:hypothetical protein ACKVWM_010654 [Pyricularia oryzae]